MDKTELAREFYGHMTKDLIPFWAGLRDDENGGFYGKVDFDHNLDKKADKGCILNSRILWFFSTAKMLLEEMARSGKGPASDGENDSEYTKLLHSFFILQLC